ncbi:RNA polymerase sigma factor [Isoptericola sp. NPDC055881]
MTTTHDGDAPARRGPADDAIERMRAAAADAGRDEGPGAAGTVDPSVLRTALATLPHDDQRLLWDRHVLGREAAEIAAELGMHARAVLHRLRRAEERLAAAFAAAHARACPPGCVDTRQSLHSYVRHRLTPVRRTVLEAHLFGCQDCMRAFIDVREAGWAVRDAGPLLLAGPVAGTVASGAAPVVVGVLGAEASGSGVLGWAGPVGAALAAAGEWVRALVLQLGQLGKGGLVAAGTVAGVAVAAVAVALGGGGGGPVAAPPVPAATASVAAPAPTATPPAAPAEPEPDASTSTPDPIPADGATPTGDPTAPATSGPAFPTPTSPTTPTTQPTTPADPTPSTPGTPGSATPGGSSSSAPDPTTTAPTATAPTGKPPTTTRPTPTPTPTPTRTTSTPRPTPTPTPTPTRDPDPVRSTVQADLPGLRGVFRVTPSQDEVEIVAVSPSKSWISARECRDGSWYVASRRYQQAGVAVTVDAPADADTSVSLVRTGIWPGWLQTC